MSKLIEGVDYTIEEGRVVFTSLYLSLRKACCGKGCRNCPFDPQGVKGSTKINPEKTDK